MGHAINVCLITKNDSEKLDKIVIVRNILRNEGSHVKQANDDERLCKKGKK